MADYIVEARSRQDLRCLARAIRRELRLESELRMPIVELLEALPEFDDKFSFEIVPDTELPKGTHATTDIRTGHITIRESVYEGACNGDGRDRMTIAHEIGHYAMLCQLGFKLQRNFDHQEVKSFCDPEWQAKCFAGEFMVDYDLTKNMSVLEIMQACGVSYAAAQYQHEHRN